MNNRKLIYLACLALAFAVVFCEHHPGVKVSAKANKAEKLVVPLINAGNEEVGEAVLTETAKGVRISLHAEGLRPGIHAIHFHEIGNCTPPDFMSSGEHFNPEHKHHGLKNPMGPHAGDMPNIFADRHGIVETVIFNPRVTLKKEKENSLRDADGSALIIHEFGDDQLSDPSGNSGKRVLCGVIR
ncbi:superoxide dismutase family protein [Sporolactobacillus pectinivorans]|uniref:superoxide dismutase family protein n=1 Tax=Sporolactobacillus pectinivorans TaxID=1591408 RepID=UPI000C25B990|nr:superoxide dismutase family protein [Sporolactobacillus pectinivorans]